MSFCTPVPFKGAGVVFLHNAKKLCALNMTVQTKSGQTIGASTIARLYECAQMCIGRFFVQIYRKHSLKRRRVDRFVGVIYNTHIDKAPFVC